MKNNSISLTELTVLERIESKCEHAKQIIENRKEYQKPNRFLPEDYIQPHKTHF